MNFNIDFSANSEKKLSSNNSLGGNFPKSISCQQINLSIELNDIDPLEDEDLVEQTTENEQVSNTTGVSFEGEEGGHYI